MKAYSVSQINNYIKSIIDTDYVLSSIIIAGEISNLKRHTSGHIYFTLKDSESSINCVMFKTNALGLSFAPENGNHVSIKGYISVYEKTGMYQLYAQSIERAGQGELFKAFMQLKQKLEAEGLFDTAHKKPIPNYAQSVAIVTSATGAAVQDILKIAGGKNTTSQIKIYSVLVQGAEAKNEISNAIKIINKQKAADVIILGRGGGSIEDLWAFNEEIVARSIFKSAIPIISAVGHETDFTIADFVADMRAATPSEAAEIAFYNSHEEKQYVLALKDKLAKVVNTKIEFKYNELKNISKRLISPSEKIKFNYLLLESVKNELQDLMRQIINENRHSLLTNIEKINALSPLNVIKRGYSLVYGENGIVKSVSDVENGEKLSISVADGKINAVVESITR